MRGSFAAPEPRTCGIIWGGSHNKDYSIERSILGYPYLEEFAIKGL